MVSSITQMPASLMFAGKQQAPKVSFPLIKRLNDELYRSPQRIFTYEARSFGESDVIIRRKSISDPENPIVLECLFVNGQREILMTVDGQVLKSTCAGKSGQRPLARAQAKSMVENFLVQLFSDELNKKP